MVYKWYILPIGVFYATYHLLREPKTAIDDGEEMDFWTGGRPWDSPKSIANAAKR